MGTSLETFDLFSLNNKTLTDVEKIVINIPFVHQIYVKEC